MYDIDALIEALESCELYLSALVSESGNKAALELLFKVSEAINKVPNAFS